MKYAWLAMGSVLVFLSAARARPVGDPFLRGMKNPAELASKIEKSLREDSSGKSIIDDERCLKDHSCASPLNYLEAFIEMFKTSNPRRISTVAELPQFLRKLEERPVHGVYWTACLVMTREGTYKALLHCAQSRFEPTEKGWFDPETDRLVLKQNCTNPVEKEVEHACANILFPSSVGDELRQKTYGVDIKNDPCTCLRRAGETECINPFIERCEDESCSFAGADSVAGSSGFEPGSFSSEAAGMNVLRVPIECTKKDSACQIFFCLRRPGGEQTCAVGVQWFDYTERKSFLVHSSDHLIAEIARTKEEAGRRSTRTGVPSQLWWNFETEDYCAW